VCPTLLHFGRHRRQVQCFSISDAAIFEASNCMGFGVIMRDHSGKCLAACCQHIEGLKAMNMQKPWPFRERSSLPLIKGRTLRSSHLIAFLWCNSLIRRAWTDRRWVWWFRTSNILSGVSLRPLYLCF
jgi:hypothetical protein